MYWDVINSNESFENAVELMGCANLKGLSPEFRLQISKNNKFQREENKLYFFGCVRIDFGYCGINEENFTLNDTAIKILEEGRIEDFISEYGDFYFKGSYKGAYIMIVKSVNSSILSNND